MVTKKENITVKGLAGKVDEFMCIVKNLQQKLEEYKKECNNNHDTEK